MSRLVPAYDARTGAKQRHYVPEAWLTHPVLGKSLRRTPKSAAVKKETNPPADGDTTTKEQ